MESFRSIVMDRRFEVRKQEMLAECEVSPEVFRGVPERMQKFVQPFADLLRLPAQRAHAADYVAGLVSDLKASGRVKFTRVGVFRIGTS